MVEPSSMPTTRVRWIALAVFEECAMVSELMGEGAQFLRRCVAVADADDSVSFHEKMLS